MRLQNPIGALSPTMDTQVLMVLSRADSEFTAREIHRMLPDDGSIGGVRLALSRLVGSGVVLQRHVGATSAYSLNRDHLMADAILAMSRTKSDLISRIGETVRTWPVQPLNLKLFGSAARDEMNADSDIDLLVVFPDAAPDGLVDQLIGELSAQIIRWTGNDTRPLVYRASEITPAPIFDSILREGIDIVGDPAWLRRRLRQCRNDV
jgi:predicted nucleotidyltransferase